MRMQSTTILAIAIPRNTESLMLDNEVDIAQSCEAAMYPDFANIPATISTATVEIKSPLANCSSFAPRVFV